MPGWGRAVKAGLGAALAGQIGEARAKELLFTARLAGADEGAQLSLI